MTTLGRDARGAAFSGPDDGLILRSPWPAWLSDAVFERVAMTLIAIGAFLPYFLINRLTLDWPARDLGGPVDRLIPFSPAWELVYISIYFTIFVLVTYIRDAALFRSAVLSFCLIQFTCFAIFLAFPVGIERPEALDLQGSFLEWGVALNYTLDQPRNLFPSLHLGNAFLVALLLVRVQRRVGLLALAWAMLIGYSTMAVKHHHFADVVAGILIAVLADRLILAPTIAAAGQRPLLNPPHYAGAVMALYPLTVLVLYGVWRSGSLPLSWPP